MACRDALEKIDIKDLSFLPAMGKPSPGIEEAFVCLYILLQPYDRKKRKRMDPEKLDWNWCRKTPQIYGLCNTSGLDRLQHFDPSEVLPEQKAELKTYMSEHAEVLIVEKLMTKSTAASHILEWVFGILLELDSA